MPQLLLGIDVGTYSSKGVLVEPDGTVLKTHIVEHTMDIPKPGWAEQDADKVWWADVVQICKTLLDGSPYTGDDVAGVALSAIGPCMLPLDKRGQPLRPGILYGVDTRASVEIELLNEKLGADNIFAFSGMALTSQAVGPKILWMQRNEPELWRQVDHITTASSYLIYKLTGEKIIDYHTASHYMPLVNMKTLEWSDKFAEHIVSLDKLPKLGWSDELAGTINSQGAKQTGLREGTPVAVGAVDALSEGLSVGVVQPGDLMIMYGSTTFFILVQERPQPDERVWTVAGAYKRQFNLAAGMATTGSLTRWFRDELARDLPEETAYAELFRRAESIPPSADGLVMLPYFSGERTPINDPLARGVIAGLNLSHTQGHVYRAVLESVAYGIRHNLEAFAGMGSTIKRVVAVGGGTKSSTWLQIVSDVAQVEQIIPKITVGASYGDAFLAGLASGILQRDDIDQWVDIDHVIQPNATNQATYDAHFALYKQLYENTKYIVHELASLE